MRISLYPVPTDVAVVGQPVGYVDATVSVTAGLRRVGAPAPKGGQVLSYDGRQALVGGRPVDHEQIAEALQVEVERAGKRVFGPEYVGPLSLASGLNVRSLSRGRILSHGLPAPLLDMLGRAAATDHPRAIGYLLQACAYLWDEHVIEHGIGEPGPAPGPMSTEGRELLARRLDDLLDRALGLVATMQGEAAAARARARPATES